jgi:F0F1-type ATP synthase membrane subunit b/b'
VRLDAHPYRKRMDPTLKLLLESLLKAVPTIFFLIVLTAYLKYIFFKPMGRMLKQRHEETEGVRKLAEQAFTAADHKTSELERVLLAAKLEISRGQEAYRHQLHADQAKAIAEARARAEERILEVRRELAAETERITVHLSDNASALAGEMLATVLGRRAA